MRKKQKVQKNRKKPRFQWILLKAIGIAVLMGTFLCAAGFFYRLQTLKKPEELLKVYMEQLAKGEYEAMYDMIDAEGSGGISKKEFVKRNANIYEGIEARNIEIKLSEEQTARSVVAYRMSMDTMAGPISFENEALFVKEKDGYRLVWQDSLIFPGLEDTDKIRVSTVQAERGAILDRNGRILAGKGEASSVGIVPGKLENRQEAIGEIAGLLELEPEHIIRKLEAGWVKEDSFVPIKTIEKAEELELLSMSPDEKVLEAKALQDMLLAIPGVMISDTEVREYPLGEAAAHLIGYVQSVTAEDLDIHEGEGYHENSVIGRSGMEALFETELKGQDGCEIYIEDDNGSRKASIASIPVQNGKNIKLTVDSNLQLSLYEQFQEDKSCSVAMNPYTGEVLALVSTPSYDNNDFILGMSEEQWTALNEEEKKPLYNRFRQVWCPGSTFKPVIAAIGLDAGAIDPWEDYGNVGLSWQKDTTWGSYYVTTLHEYEPVVLENALMYSDNIYFAKAALKIGAETLGNALQKLGFNEELPFEIAMSVSQYSNTERIETEIQLADSGYGQGQILVNPLHLAALYTSFFNQGNVIKPRLLYEEGASGEIWLAQAFSADTTQKVLDGMKKVINEPEGTGYAAHREDICLAGKTGTAEIKATTEDTSGTELGWFAVFTAEEGIKNPVLLVSMTEDVKEIGGSGYVVAKDKAVLDGYLGGQVLLE